MSHSTNFEESLSLVLLIVHVWNNEALKLFSARRLNSSWFFVFKSPQAHCELKVVDRLTVRCRISQCLVLIFHLIVSSIILASYGCSSRNLYEYNEYVYIWEKLIFLKGKNLIIFCGWKTKIPRQYRNEGHISFKTTKSIYVTFFQFKTTMCNQYRSKRNVSSIDIVIPIKKICGECTGNWRREYALGIYPNTFKAII